MLRYSDKFFFSGEFINNVINSVQYDMRPVLEHIPGVNPAVGRDTGPLSHSSIHRSQHVYQCGRSAPGRTPRGKRTKPTSFGVSIGVFRSHLLAEEVGEKASRQKQNKQLQRRQLV